VACLLLATAADYRRQGLPVPPIYITHSSTGVENPVVADIATSELKKMEVFAAKHDFFLQVLNGEPDINSGWVGRVLTGRALPTYPSSPSMDCSISWKILVMRRLLNDAMRLAGNHSEWGAPVVMTGVRQGESAARDQRIAERKEHGDGIWASEEGELRLSPIFSFDTDSVWEVLGYANAGILNSFSDFAQVIEFYTDAGGGCVVVTSGAAQRSGPPCGARSGCWACCRSGKSDRSAEQLVASNESKYGRLKPLNRLRTWLVNIQYDWSMRHFIGRTISHDGFIEAGADSFSPETLRKLLIYTLTAERLSGVPIISPAQLILVDAKWSASAIAPPFFAIKTYFDVMDRGMWEEAPVVPFAPPSPAPKLGRIPVGEDWYQVTGFHSMNGMRDAMMELHHESCGVTLKTLKNGALVIDYEDGPRLDVDMDGAADFLAFLADDYIRDYCHHEYSDWTEGFRIYQRLGILSLGAGHSRKMDEILRRSQWLQSQELHGQRTPEEVKAKCSVRYEYQALLF
jgi:3'-phosphoadenosine 5'-phosphosulfate sulfotransferase (PAPS reductase)/FAD synthetase